MIINSLSVNNLKNTNNILFQQNNNKREKDINNNNVNNFSLGVLANYNKAGITFTGANKSLHNKKNNGILNGKGKNIKDKKMSLYSVCTGHEFSSDNKVIQNFDTAIRTLNYLGKNNLPTDKETLSEFHENYSNAVSEINTNGKVNSDLMLHIFCSLLECMDNSESDEIFKNVGYCLFDNFIPRYKSNETLKATTEKICSSDLLQNKLLDVRLKINI